MKGRLLLAALLAVVAAGVAALAGSMGGSAAAKAAYPVPHPTVTDFQFIKGSTPSEADCEAVARTCFTPQAIRSAYNLAPLYAKGWNGSGVTIAIIDSYGSDTMAHDLHVFDQTFGLQQMCGEEGVTVCTTGMPKFSELAINGSPTTKPQPGNGTHLEDKSAWALEVALDVETSHAIAPMANILLVHSNNAETLGVQGFPNLMKAEDYVVSNHLAQVISQSFGSAEDAFNGTASLQNLRYAFQHAAANGVTVLASSGDGGSANGMKSPVPTGGKLIPYPTVGWPASDPLVTGVGGTYLCTDPTANGTPSRATYIKPGIGAKCGSSSFNAAGAAEVAWTFSGGGFSRVFARPSYQAGTLPAGSTAIPPSARGVPDIALQASSATGALVYLSLPPDGNNSNINQTGWYDIGGTSLSSPQWAGLVAIADQINKASHPGEFGLGLINPALYKLAANPAQYSSDFFDVNHTGAAGVANDNQGDPSVPGFPATNGWDPVTGLGTPNAANLLPDLVVAAH
jgi:subtilase family serine protease